MLAAAEYFVAGQPLKLKASTPLAALDEAMEYLIQNTFSKMSYLKRLTAEPLKEIQAVLRSNDIAKENLLFQTGENNPEALEDLRSYLQLCSMKSQQVVLHDMLEKRYALRPYGWPDEEVLLLLARLIVLERDQPDDGLDLVAHRQGVRGDHHPGEAPQDRHPQAGDLRPQGDPECPEPGQRPVRRDGAGRRGRPVHLPANEAQGLADLRSTATSSWPTPGTTPAGTRSRKG